MARRTITQKLYGDILAAFREDPGNFTHAAAKAKIHRATATRAWKRGWPKLGWAPAIHRVIEGEQKQTRAAIAEETARVATVAAQADAEKVVRAQAAAKSDALDSRVQETKLVRAARENTLFLMGTVQQLLRGSFKLSQQTEQMLAGATLTDLTIGQRVRHIAIVGRLAHDANDAAKIALQLERLLVGAPTEIIGLANVSIEDAERETRRTLALIEEAKKLGVIPQDEGSSDGTTPEPAAGVGGNGNAPIVH